MDDVAANSLRHGKLVDIMIQKSLHARNLEKKSFTCQSVSRSLLSGDEVNESIYIIIYVAVDEITLRPWLSPT